MMPEWQNNENRDFGRWSDAWDITLIQTPLPLLAATTGLSGVLFLLLRILIEVQVRIYSEARARPPYKISRIVQHPASPQRRAAPIGANPGAL
jgi:hypothetical protein